MDLFRRTPATGWLIFALVAFAIGWALLVPVHAFGATEAVLVDPTAIPENQPSILDRFLSPALMDRIESFLIDVILGLGMGLIYALWAWVQGKDQLNDEDKKDVILERIRDFARRGLELEADLLRKKMGMPPGTILSHDADDDLLIGAVNYVAKAGAESLDKLGVKVKQSAFENGNVIITEGAQALTNLVRATRAVMKNEEIEKAMASSTGAPAPMTGAKIRRR